MPMRKPPQSKKGWFLYMLITVVSPVGVLGSVTPWVFFFPLKGPITPLKPPCTSSTVFEKSLDPTSELNSHGLLEGAYKEDLIEDEDPIKTFIISFLIELD